MRTVLTLGNFDGPHRGHLAILRQARELADEHGDEVVAITFDPPPVEILRPGSQPPRISSVAERIVSLRTAGADRVEVLHPTVDWLARSAKAFIEDLMREYEPRFVVEGPDFRFGSGRAGDMGLMEHLGGRLGFSAVTVPRMEQVLSDQSVVPLSSSLVRWLVGHGRVHEAAQGLGRPFALTAQVIRGEQRGRTIGVPTVNLDMASLAGFILPANGVYAGWARIDDAALPAAISVGVKPTFGQATLTVEAHLLDFSGDLYGQRVTLQFGRWLRDQYAFPGLSALTDQLSRDIDATRLHSAGPKSPARLAN